MGTGGALTRAGGNTWFFLTADYAFGSALEADTSKVVIANGGKVVGSVRHPLSNQDFSSFLLQAQGSKAKVIGLANAGLDTSNAIKQAAEYGIVEGGQKLAALLFTLSEVHGLGLKVAQGLTLTEELVLGCQRRDPRLRPALHEAHRPDAQHDPGRHLLGGPVLPEGREGRGHRRDRRRVNAKLKALPVDDVFAHGGTVQPDGLMVHDMYLFEVKKPAESKSEWDLYKLISTIPGKEAFASPAESGCPLTAAAK